MDNIKEYYEGYWSNPSDYDDPTTPMRIELLKRHLSSFPAGSRVLDAGCGRGEFCQTFKQMGMEPTGTDLSEAVIEYARSQFPDLDWRACMIEELLPEHTKAFDAVFSSEVIEHLFDVTGFLATANGLLKDDGTLVLTTPYHGLIKNLLIDCFGYDRHYDPAGQHVRFFDRKGLTRCLEMTGFRVEHLTGYGRPWPLWKSFFVVAKKVRHMDHKPAFGTQGVVVNT